VSGFDAFVLFKQGYLFSHGRCIIGQHDLGYNIGRIGPG
jgi:hypothetical protein